MDQQPTCSLCGLQVMVEGDELSLDIGGHCIGCIIQAEAMSGHEPSKRRVEQEIAKGWRSSDGTRIGPGNGLHTVSFRKVGAYLGRDVRLGQLPIAGEVEQLSADVVMLIPLKGVSEEIAKAELHALLKQEPLALMVAGPMAEVLFDAMLRLLNDGQDRPHTMTWISRFSDIPSAIEEFLYAVLPADTRWDDWTGYVVFAGAEWTDTVRKAVSTR